jgi:hypothetical protein
MEDKNSSKICQSDKDPCKRDAQALCFHCSKNLCRIHLLQHAQVIEEKARVELNLLADKFNELSSRFEDISIASDVIEKPFEELEKWSIGAHRKIDQIVENKRREINDMIGEYRMVFDTEKDKQIKKINVSKTFIVQFIQEADISRKQMDDFQASINEAEEYLRSLNTHEIKLNHSPPICFFDVETQFFDYQPTPTGELWTFKITYIRLNGTIRKYYVKTKKHGLMSNLKNSFVRQYNLFEEITRVELNSNSTINHQPKSDFILPVKIYNFGGQMQYNDNTNLASILNEDMIVFYETPYSLADIDNPRILMLCKFRRSLTNKSFGFPIYLNVPRNGCKGQDVLDALYQTLGNFFPLNAVNNPNLFRATLVFNVSGQFQLTRKTLTDTLEDPMDFNKLYITLDIDIDNAIADMYENNQIKYEGYE